MPFKGLQLIAQFNFQRAPGNNLPEKSLQTTIKVPFRGQKTRCRFLFAIRHPRYHFYRYESNLPDSNGLSTKFLLFLSVTGSVSKERARLYSDSQMTQEFFWFFLTFLTDDRFQSINKRHNMLSHSMLEIQQILSTKASKEVIWRLFEPWRGKFSIFPPEFGRLVPWLMSDARRELWKVRSRAPT